MKKSALIFLIFIFLGCEKNANSVLISKINSIDANILAYYRRVVIVPNKGCDFCIAKAYDFMQDKAKDNSVFFIITLVDSEKSLRLKLNQLQYLPNVYIDTRNMFINTKIDSIYPAIIVLNGSNIENVKLVDATMNIVDFFN